MQSSDDQVVDRSHRLGLGNRNGVGRDNMSLSDDRIRQAAASDCGLDDQLLLLDKTLGRDQGLLIGRNLSLRPRHLDRCLLALFHLMAVVFIQPLCQPQCFVLHLDVFI